MNKLSSILGGAAVLAIAFVFVVTFRPQSGAKTVDTGPSCIAEVHGTCIPNPWYRAAFKMIASRLNDGNSVRTMHLHQEAADGLVEMQVLNDDAKRLGISIGSDDVSREFIAGRFHVSLPAKDIRDFAPRLGIEPQGLFLYMPVRGKSKKFEQKAFEKTVRQLTGLSTIDFRDWQTKELLAARMRDLVRARVHIGDEEVYEQYAREKSTATIDYVKFDAHWYAEFVDASPKAVDEWSQKNTEALQSAWEQRKTEFLPECRVTRHILARVDETTGSDEQKAAAKKKIETALERVNKGEDFAAVAREMSDDSAKTGGELGCMTAARLVKPFADAMSALEPGKVSGIVQTQYGYHILRVDQIAKGADAERVGKQIIAKDQYLGHEASVMAADGAKRVMVAAKAGTALGDALKAYMDDFLTSHKPADKKDDGKKGEKKADKKADKDGDKKDEGKKDEGKKDDAEPEETAATSPLRPQLDTSLPFTSQGDPVPGVRGMNDVAKIAFALKTPGELPADLIAYDGGFLIVSLKEKTPASRDEFAKNKEFYARSMRDFKQADALLSYMRRLTGNLGPEAKPAATLVADSKPRPPGSGAPAEDVPEPQPADDDGE